MVSFRGMVTSKGKGDEGKSEGKKVAVTPDLLARRPAALLRRTWSLFRS